MSKIIRSEPFFPSLIPLDTLHGLLGLSYRPLVCTLAKLAGENGEMYHDTALETGAL